MLAQNEEVAKPAKVNETLEIRIAWQKVTQWAAMMSPVAIMGRTVVVGTRKGTRR
jgi:hypothetical protein